MKSIAERVELRFSKQTPGDGPCRKGHDREQTCSRGLLAVLVSLLALLSTAGNNPDSGSGVPAPQTPREFFNAGTQKLREGKLREAEALFESALAAQNEQLQPQTMFNLGHVRYDQGVEELK